MPPKSLTWIESKPREDHGMTPEDADNALPAKPHRAKERGVRGRYVEALCDARTTREGFYLALR